MRRETCLPRPGNKNFSTPLSRKRIENDVLERLKNFIGFGDMRYKRIDQDVILFIPITQALFSFRSNFSDDDFTDFG